jgi:hypothetical protein
MGVSSDRVDPFRAGFLAFVSLCCGFELSRKLGVLGYINIFNFIADYISNT